MGSLLRRSSSLLRHISGVVACARSSCLPAPSVCQLLRRTSPQFCPSPSPNPFQSHSRAMTSISLTYPETRRSSHVDTYHGQSVPDPYSWLENPDAEEVVAWVDEQNALTQSYLAPSEDRVLLKQRLLSLFNYERFSCPFRRGERYFYSYNSGLQNQAVLRVQDGLDESSRERVLLDPNTLAEDGTASLGEIAFSEDGAWLAYGVSRSGSDWQSIEVLKVEDGAVQSSDKLHWVKFGTIAWTHDHAGFFYSRFPTPPSFEGKEDDSSHKKGSETDKLQNHAVYYHRLGTEQSSDIRVFATPEQPDWIFKAQVSDDGQYLLISISESTDPVNQLYYYKLTEQLSYGLSGAIDDGAIVRLVNTFDNKYSYITNEGSTFFFKTNLDAPRYRVISLDVSKPGFEGRRDVIEQKEDVLTYVTCVNDSQLAIVYMHNASDQLHLYGLDGKHIQTIALPDIGCVQALSGRKQDAKLFYQFTSFLHPGAIFSIDLSSSPLSPQLFRETKLAGFNAADYRTEQVWYDSKDGTRVPMFIVSARAHALPPAQPLPVHLYGYGGFNISITPYFSVTRLIWLQQFGGLYVVANIRGGGEFGEEWHNGGVRDKKQNVFDDFIAAAEWLIRHKYTEPRLLSIEGGSNGGLLVGACVNQRPELFGAAVAAVGVMDMLNIGHFWTKDYGSSDDADAFPYLLRISPVHNVQTAQPYGAILLTTGDHDDRVVPLHSYKYVAALQHQWAGKAEQKQPLLIRIETKAGHGAGMPLAKRMAEQADVYAFIAMSSDIKLQWTTEQRASLKSQSEEAKESAQ